MDTVSVLGMRLSKMTLGTVQLGMEYGVANTLGKPSAKEAFAILDAALAGGVSCLDTARLYGDSEQVIGAYLADRKPGELSVVTKFAVDPAGDVSPKGIAGQIEASVETSLHMLGLASLPLLMLHRADDMKRYRPVLAETLRGLRRDGLVDRFGVSVYDAGQIDEMLRDELYEAVQLPMNLFDSRLARSGHMDRLREAGIAVFVRSVFLQGLFFMDHMPPGFRHASAYVKRLHALAARAGRGVGEIALVYVRDLPGIASLVLGAESAVQAAENIALMEAPPLSLSLRQELDALSREAPIEEIMAELMAR